ncbi:MAG: hypothetical protein KAH18_06670 [Psychromonas sp.]|nr:hypothetical protein [Psychromonas sp.]
MDHLQKELIKKSSKEKLLASLETKVTAMQNNVNLTPAKLIKMPEWLYNTTWHPTIETLDQASRITFEKDNFFISFNARGETVSKISTIYLNSEDAIGDIKETVPSNYSYKVEYATDQSKVFYLLFVFDEDHTSGTFVFRNSDVLLAIFDINKKV